MAVYAHAGIYDETIGGIVIPASDIDDVYIVYCQDCYQDGAQCESVGENLWRIYPNKETKLIEWAYHSILFFVPPSARSSYQFTQWNELHWYTATANYQFTQWKEVSYYNATANYNFIQWRNLSSYNATSNYRYTQWRELPNYTADANYSITQWEEVQSYNATANYIYTQERAYMAAASYAITQWKELSYYNATANYQFSQWKEPTFYNATANYKLTQWNEIQQKISYEYLKKLGFIEIIGMAIQSASANYQVIQWRELKYCAASASYKFTQIRCPRDIYALTLIPDEHLNLHVDGFRLEPYDKLVLDGREYTYSCGLFYTIDDDNKKHYIAPIPTGYWLNGAIYFKMDDISEMYLVRTKHTDHPQIYKIVSSHKIFTQISE
jgi:hypothetical protein